MANYAKGLPTDKDGNPMQEYPAPYLSQEQYNNTALGAVSSVITLQPTTSAIEVGAFGGQGVVIRWIPTTETAAVSPFASVISSGLGANFDHYIPPTQYRRFVVPKETIGTSAGQVGSVNGLYQRIAVNSAGATVSSVLLSEF